MVINFQLSMVNFQWSIVNGANNGEGVNGATTNYTNGGGNHGLHGWEMGGIAGWGGEVAGEVGSGGGGVGDSAAGGEDAVLVGRRWRKT